MNAAPQLGIVELHAVCTDLQRRNQHLFETLGRWVATTEPPAVQQLAAEAGHRHAWHAQLWAERMPTIPADDPNVSPPAALDDADRLASYRTALGDLLAAVEALTGRIEPQLDPSTARVIDLVTADLMALAERATGLA